MLHAEQQIVQAYEELELTPEEIASESGMGWDVAAVKTCLLAHSPKFNQDNKQAVAKGETPLYDKSDVDLMKIVVKSIAMGGEVEAVRLKAALSIINEAKGRNDVKVSKDAGRTINIIHVHQQMAKAREAKARSLAQPIVEIPATVTTH